MDKVNGRLKMCIRDSDYISQNRRIEPYDFHTGISEKRDSGLD